MPPSTNGARENELAIHVQLLTLLFDKDCIWSSVYKKTTDCILYTCDLFLLACICGTSGVIADRRIDEKYSD